MLAQPVLQNCTISNGGGTASANVANIAVTCSNTPATLALTIQQTRIFHLGWSAVSGATSCRLMEDPTGTAGYSQVGADLPAGTTFVDLKVPLLRRLNAKYMVSACAGNTCVDSNVVAASGSLASAVGYFKGLDAAANGDFGFSVALSADGNTLAVGADIESSNATGINGNQADNSVNLAGAAYLY